MSQGNLIMHKKKVYVIRFGSLKLYRIDRFGSLKLYRIDRHVDDTDFRYSYEW